MVLGWRTPHLCSWRGTAAQRCLGPSYPEAVLVGAAPGAEQWLLAGVFSSSTQRQDAEVFVRYCG